VREVEKKEKEGKTEITGDESGSTSIVSEKFGEKKRRRRTNIIIASTRSLSRPEGLQDVRSRLTRKKCSKKRKIATRLNKRRRN